MKLRSLMFLYILIRLFDNHLNSLRTAKCLDIKGNHKGVAFESNQHEINGMAK